MTHRAISRVVLCLGLLFTQFSQTSEVFYLKRVQSPSVHQVKTEKADQLKRQVKRYGVKYGSILSIMLAMYVSYKASEYFKDHEKKIKKLEIDAQEAKANRAIAASIVDDWISRSKALVGYAETESKSSSGDSSSSLLAPVWWVTGGVKSVGSGFYGFGRDLGKCFIESAPTFITGMVLTSGWNNLMEKRSDALRQESISWFIDKHTKLWPLFVDLKSSCVQYDLYSDLLSVKNLHGSASVHMKSFIKDLTELVKVRKEDDMLDDAFFEYQCDELRKQYAKKGSEVEVLQNYAAPAMAKRKRIIDGNFDEAYLFGMGKIGKQDIVDMCDVLVGQVQKVAAFATVHLDNYRDTLSASCIKRGENKITQMIDVTNAYLDHMEKLLNTDLKDLVEVSKANHGMFTSTYEFEKCYRDIVNNIHRYCMMINE